MDAQFIENIMYGIHGSPVGSLKPKWSAYEKRISWCSS